MILLELYLFLPVRVLTLNKIYPFIISRNHTKINITGPHLGLLSFVANTDELAHLKVCSTMVTNHLDWVIMLQIYHSGGNWNIFEPNQIIWDHLETTISEAIVTFGVTLLILQ